MKTWKSIVIGSIAITASACAQTSTHVAAHTVFVPRGQAAQPGWIAAEPEDNAVDRVGTTASSARGQAAQPGWSAEAETLEIAMHTNQPRGRAAQPGSWPEERPGAPAEAVVYGSAEGRHTHVRGLSRSVQ